MSREPFLEFENYPSTNTPLSATNLNNMQLSIVDAIKNNGGITILKSVLEAPTTFSTGDKYYDSTDDLIYTAISSSEWDDGETPSNIVIYINEADNKLYRYYNNSMNEPIVDTLPVVLYENPDDLIHTSITLNDSVENYSRIKIFYSYLSTDANTFGNSSVEVYNANDKVVLLNEVVDNGTYCYPCIAEYKISGTSMTKQLESRWRIGTSGNATRTANPNVMQINKVLGYPY